MSAYCVECLHEFPEDEVVKLCELQESGIKVIPENKVEHCTMSQSCCGLPLTLNSFTND